MKNKARINTVDSAVLILAILIYTINIFPLKSTRISFL